MQGQHKPKNSLQRKLGGSASPQQKEIPFRLRIIGLGKSSLAEFSQTEVIALAKP
jgi:hypothetical protein